MPLGVHVDDLPVDEFVLQACGTNGGPPSLFLDGFAEFGRCAPEPGTGLHEVWFSYDNEAEYIARALRAPEEEMARFRANQLFLHPVFFSFLIDGAARRPSIRVLWLACCRVILRRPGSALSAKSSCRQWWVG